MIGTQAGRKEGRKNKHDKEKKNWRKKERIFAE